MSTKLVGDPVWYLLRAGWYCPSANTLPQTLPEVDQWRWWKNNSVAQPIPLDAAVLLQQRIEKRLELLREH